MFSDILDEELNIVESAASVAPPNPGDIAMTPSSQSGAPSTSPSPALCTTLIIL